MVETARRAGPARKGSTSPIQARRAASRAIPASSVARSSRPPPAITASHARRAKASPTRPRLRAFAARQARASRSPVKNNARTALVANSQAARVQLCARSALLADTRTSKGPPFVSCAAPAALAAGMRQQAHIARIVVLASISPLRGRQRVTIANQASPSAMPAETPATRAMLLEASTVISAPRCACSAPAAGSASTAY